MNFSYAHYQAGAAAFLRVHPILSLSAGGQYMHFVFAYYHHQDRIVVIDRHQSASGIIFKSRVVKLAKLRPLVVPYGLMMGLKTQYTVGKNFHFSKAGRGRPKAD